MRMIRGNVERIAETRERTARLLAEGFTEMPEASGGDQGVSEAAGQAHQDSENEPLAPDEQIEAMGVQKLRTLAKKRGLGSCSGLSREQLVAVLRENG
ncbi:MAG TPA: hypothetical protein DF613_16705 [Lachnospiraceae bacterium]|nr:hypothetical protein [Lachnospiraceae bacterium]